MVSGENMLSISEVLRRLDEDSDDDFDGYIDEDEIESENEDSEFIENEMSSPVSSESFEGIPDYVLQPGCTKDTTDMTPLDFFSMLVEDKMLQNTVEQTNLFADQFLEADNIPPKSRALLWGNKVHDINELKKFISIVIIMGIVHYPSIEDYWATTWPFGTDAYSSIMKRDRFCLLLRFLHLNDNRNYIRKGLEGHDPQYKVRPFMDALIGNFKSSCIPGREISIDESMIGFKGRIGFLQYAPKKPTKWGMKAFLLADSITGYTCNWKLYTGMYGKSIKAEILLKIQLFFYYHKPVYEFGVSLQHIGEL